MDFEQLRKDMEDGTDGPWVAQMRHPTNACIEVFANHPFRSGLASLYNAPEDEQATPRRKDDSWGDQPARDANARRMARVPDLERIALAAEKYRKANETVRTASSWEIASLAAVDRAEARDQLFSLLSSKDAT